MGDGMPADLRLMKCGKIWRPSCLTKNYCWLFRGQAAVKEMIARSAREYPKQSPLVSLIDD